MRANLSTKEVVNFVVSNHESDAQGVLECCEYTAPGVEAYLITRSISDLGDIEGIDAPPRIMRIPAPLLCYWMGSTEIESANKITFE